MIRVGSMFSGVGGLDLAVHALFPDAEPAWFFEWEDAPAAVLAHHWPDVPNHRDVTRWADVDLDPVDVMVGGFPCQDISHAGKGAGLREGTRSGLWYRMADAIGALRPRLVLLENVAAILARGGPAVVGSLAALGYDARWDVVRAADVGAPHRRERWFLVAHPHDAGRGEQRRPVAVRPEQHSAERARDDAAGCPMCREPLTGLDDPRHEACELRDLADYNEGFGLDVFGRPLTLLPTPAVNDMGEGKSLDWWDEWAPRQTAADGRPAPHGRSLSIEARRLLPTPASWDGARGPDLARAGRPESGGMDLVTTVERLLPTPTAGDSRGSGSRVGNPDTAAHPGTSLTDATVRQPERWGEYADAIARWEAVLGRPAPSPTDDKGRLSPRFVEWLMGWPDGWTKAAGTRSKRLKACGNGVVPQQALAAYRHLLADLDDEVAA